MFNTITTCRLSHYFRLKTCSSFLSHSQVFHLMFVIKYVTVLSGKYPANFTRIPDSAGCLHFTGYRIVLSGSGTSLLCSLMLLHLHCMEAVLPGCQNSSNLVYFPDITQDSTPLMTNVVEQIVKLIGEPRNYGTLNFRFVFLCFIYFVVIVILRC